jgi:lipopolysaccharide export system ATP-binding protein
MTRQPWIDRVAERDPSIAIALAALTRDASPEGAIPLDRLVASYREAFLAVGTGIEARPAMSLSGDAVREHLLQSLLPRMATDRWVAPDPTGAWKEVWADLSWWRQAVVDRPTVLADLLAAARAGLERPLEVPASRAEPTGSVLEGKALSKSFKGRRVVDDVTVRVRQGEIVGLLGPNGAGKTTTFYLITGLTRADAGEVLLDGEDLTTAPMFRRARQGLGYLAQEPSVFRRMTVEENILAILETRPLSRQARRQELERMLDELSIKHLRHSRAYALSGGERRRLEITRALVTGPKFMLLDEPFAGVDPIAVHDIQTIVAGLRHRGIGVLITDHNVEQTLDIVDRAYIMFEGKVQAAGTVRELVYNDQVAQLYLGPTLTARLRARLGAVA